MDTTLYLFDNTGQCIQQRTYQSEKDARDDLVNCHYSDFLISEQFVSFQFAWLRDGLLYDIRQDIDRQREEDINVARGYLASTDWYYARFAETGEAVPDEIVQKRIASRTFLREQGL